MTAPARVLTASRTLTAVKGKVLYFDGTDDYVEVPDDPSLDITNAITIEAWVKIPTNADLSSTNPIVGRSTNWDYEKYDGFHLRPKNSSMLGRIIVKGDGVFSATYSADPRDNTWHHWTVTYDKNKVLLYKDGVEVASKDANGNPFTGTWLTNLQIGRYLTYASGRHFNGTIALVRIYERALSASEVLYNKEHPYNPILHGCVLWLGHDSIDEGAGMWYDKSGLNNHGTIYGATAVEMNKLAGRVLSV